ncbi:MAG: PA0069 family radical SAM protein [Pseudomonadota bacterium]
MPLPIEKSRRKARGARTNAVSRYERFSREEEDDGWDIPEDRDRFQTHVSDEHARTIISYNRSPDLPFDRSINPYRGCEHGCVYCFARPTHAYLGLSPGLDFETRLIARPNAAALLTRELRAKSYRAATLAIGTNTDPYQPIERDRLIMRDCLKVLAGCGHPVGIVTKGTLIERDLDILAPMAAHGLVRVGISVTTLDPVLSRRMEPRAPAPARRLATIRKLADAGVPVRVMASPLVPGLTDAELEAILEQGRNAGATAASWIMLRLPLEVSFLWQDWLLEHYPNRVDRVMSKLREMHGGKTYSANWQKRMRGSGENATLIGARFKLAVRRLGLAESLPPLKTDLFEPPQCVGDQLQLF